MYSKIDKLILELDTALYIQPHSKNIDNIIYKTLMLPDKSYKQLFCQISFNMNVDVKVVMETFQNLVHSKLKQNHNIQKNSHYDLVQFKSVSKLQKTKQTQNARKSKLDLMQFNSRFEMALKSALLDLNKNANIMNSQEVCKELSAHFKVYNQTPFWNKIHSFIPEKTPIQLKEYFQKSFSKCLYEQINAEDESILKNLEQKMKDKKPAEIADVFMEITRQKYFKRSIIIQIVNSRQ
ncbi:Hypothetical_protein [Hexamita inflata]|uniref:Hypothetical_protein n=1 Tax=Hexamita inflata TaxID=28002 RepID=A0AA86TDU4_9EUKA|nr:Hypothetical protein HINF_LOCUS1217 [Hexamita inflata]